MKRKTTKTTKAKSGRRPASKPRQKRAAESPDSERLHCPECKEEIARRFLLDGEEVLRPTFPATVDQPPAGRAKRVRCGCGHVTIQLRWSL